MAVPGVDMERVCPIWEALGTTLRSLERPQGYLQSADFEADVARGVELVRQRADSEFLGLSSGELPLAVMVWLLRPAPCAPPPDDVWFEVRDYYALHGLSCPPERSWEPVVVFGAVADQLLSAHQGAGTGGEGPWRTPWSPAVGVLYDLVLQATQRAVTSFARVAALLFTEQSDEERVEFERNEASYMLSWLIMGECPCVTQVPERFREKRQAHCTKEHRLALWSPEKSGGLVPSLLQAVAGTCNLDQRLVAKFLVRGMLFARLYGSSDSHYALRSTNRLVWECSECASRHAQETPALSAQQQRGAKFHHNYPGSSCQDCRRPFDPTVDRQAVVEQSLVRMADSEEVRLVRCLACANLFPAQLPSCPLVRCQHPRPQAANGRVRTLGAWRRTVATTHLDIEALDRMSPFPTFPQAFFPNEGPDERSEPDNKETS